MLSRSASALAREECQIAMDRMLRSGPAANVRAVHAGPRGAAGALPIGFASFVTRDT